MPSSVLFEFFADKSFEPLFYQPRLDSFVEILIKRVIAAQKSAIEKRRSHFHVDLSKAHAFGDASRRVTDFEACEKAGINGKTTHDFRRTVARDLRRAGVSETVCMTITGRAFDPYGRDAIGMYVQRMHPDVTITLVDVVVTAMNPGIRCKKTFRSFAPERSRDPTSLVITP